MNKLNPEGLVNLEQPFIKVIHTFFIMNEFKKGSVGAIQKSM